MKRKTKIVSILAASSLLAAVAWFAHVPTDVQAGAVPENCRETIRKGLDYLAGKQFKDGHWEGDGGAHPVAMTGLAGLAFLMQHEHPDDRAGIREGGESKLDEKRSATIRKAADWLIAQSEPDRDGLIFSGHDSETSRYMLGHGLATIFLAGACEFETDHARRKKLTEVLTGAVKYIASAQSTQGGWHDTSKVEGHDFASIPATVIQIQALWAAGTDGISVPSAAHDGLAYVKAALEKNCSAAETAAAFACLSRRGFELAKSPPNWVDRCRSAIPRGKDLKLGRDEFAHYCLSQAEFNLGGDSWIAYRTAMFDRLRNAQNKDGSWPAGNGPCTGQVYSTAIWCTVLQLDNESHPSRKPSDIFLR